MTKYSLVDIRGSAIYDIAMNTNSLVDEVFSIGVTLEGVRRISDYELVMLALSNDYFMELFKEMGIDIKDDSAWTIDDSRGVSKEVTSAVQKAAGTLFIRELNLLHAISTTIAKDIGVTRIPYKIAGYMTGDSRTDPDMSSFVKHLGDFCSQLDTKRTRRIKYRNPRSYDLRKYTVNDINERLDELYLDAASINTLGNAIRDTSFRRAVIEIVYQPISEYLEKRMSDGEEISNGYVYYTRRGESVYFTHVNHVLKASIRYDKDKIGCVEIFDNGSPTTLITRQDFESHGIYTNHQSAALSVGSDNVEVALSKSIIEYKKEIDSLKEKIKKVESSNVKLEITNTELKLSIADSKSKLIEQNTKRIIKESADVSSKSSIKRVADTLSHTKVAVLSIVAILGGAYTIKSYMSSE